MRFSIEVAKRVFGDKEIIACEIGTLKGENALSILKNLNIKKIYLIDPYERYEAYENDSSSKILIEAKKKAHEGLKEYENKIVWIEKYSDKAVEDIKEKLDFVYIDGNHFSPYVDNDIKNYYSLVKDGGIVSGHDYSIGWKDVIIAVNSFFKNKEVKIKNRDWVIEK